MTQLDPARYKRLTVGSTYGSDDGLYHDVTNDQICAVLGDTIVARFDATGMAADLEFTSEANGDILRRVGGVWAALSAKTAGAQVVGDGTDVVLANTSALLESIDAYKKNRCFVNFLQEQAVPIFAKNTMLTVTAATQEDFFRVRNHYFELSQGTANTALAAAGLTPGAGGWLLPGDNAAAEWIEITRGIVLGSAKSFLSGTDAFRLRCVFLITTRANHTHLYCGFRGIDAYADAKTNTDHLNAYEDKAAIGISSNAGVLTRHTSITGATSATNAAHAAAANNDVLALEVSISAAGAVVCKIGHATPAGTSAAEYEAARVAAIADLAVDASIEAVPESMTTAINFVPYIAYGMAGAAAASDTRIMSFETDYV